MKPLSPDEEDFLTTRGAALLRTAGVSGSGTFVRLSGGRNNRVYRVEGIAPTLVAKWYFRHPQDERDRLHAEFAFLEFAATIQPDCTPRPLACSVSDRLALYSWVDGQPLQANDLDEPAVAQAVAFLRRLNADRDRREAIRLPLASEACFSLQQHIDCVGGRVARLRELPESTDAHIAAKQFVRERLIPALGTVSEVITRWATRAGVDLRLPVPNRNRCISPSDFGFHNALRQKNGNLFFLDFEYAGWDDPAKTLCDFFCQPRLPVPRDHWPMFAAATAELAGDSELERARQAALFPLYQIKWCCILLNEFLPTAEARRSFAEPRSIDWEIQLTKARRLIEAVEAAT